MNKKEIVDTIYKYFSNNKEHVTLIGEGVLVLGGIIDSCDYITLNLDPYLFSKISVETEKDMHGETLNFFDDNICICCKRNINVYKIARSDTYGFNSQTITSAVTYLRDQVGHFRYELMNNTITEKDKDDLKHMLNVLDNIMPKYSAYKKNNIKVVFRK